MSIARATNQPLVLLTVWEGVETVFRSASGAAARAIDLDGRALRQRYLDEVTQRVGAEGIEVAKEIRDGRPSEELLWYCDQHTPGLLVMAMHGRSGIERMWYGSVATKPMYMAHVPTLLVGPQVLEDAKGSTAIRNILVPLSGSPLGESGLEPAATLAEALEARLILARAARLPTEAFAFDLAPAHLRALDEEVIAEAERYLPQVREIVRTARRVESRVLRGFPAAAILECVARDHVDLVVMASHTRRGALRRALGSVANRVIQGPAPVLLIGPEVATPLTRSEQVRGRYCHNCGREVAYVEIGHDDFCLRCGHHLHVCANCVCFESLACLLQRSEAHTTYPGLTCPKSQFIKTAKARRPAVVGTAQ